MMAITLLASTTDPTSARVSRLTEHAVAEAQDAVCGDRSRMVVA